MVGCGYCTQFKPEWEKFQEQYPSGKTKLKDGSTLILNTYSTGDKDGLAKINEDNIAGFPTITIQKKDATDPVPYTGQRTVEDLWNAIVNPTK